MKRISVVLLVFLIGMVFTLCSQISLSSNDGVTWIKYSGNPLDLGDSSNIEHPWIIHDGHMFRMWYTGETDPGMHQIYFADSLDGISWTRHGIVLDKGETGSWDDLFVGYPMVLYDGTTYKMWYLGFSLSATVWGMIGYATSSNGINWTKHGANPVLAPGGNGGWDDWSISSPPKVIFNGTHYMMWYSAQAFRDSNRKMGAATSIDGISWTKHPNNPVLVPGPGGWDSRNVWPGPVIMNGTHFKMWYTGEAYSGKKIGLAASSDGFSWSKFDGNPVLDRGLSGEWDSDWVWSSCIVEKDNKLLMWYTGHYLGGHERIGLATSYARAPRKPTTWAVDIDPDILNLKRKGKWVTAYIELPEGYDVGDIDVCSITMNQTVSAEHYPVEIGDYDDDTIPDLTVKFNRAAVSEFILSKGIKYGYVTLKVAGQLSCGNVLFEGSDVVRVKMPGDVNGDGKVSVLDLVLAIKACGSYPGHPRWNPMADENEDNKINICDIIIILINLRKTW